MLLTFFPCFSLSLSFNQFWGRSPLIINVTVTIAVIIVIISFLYFLIKNQCIKKWNRNLLKGKSITTMQPKFDPKDDNDVNRPLAVIAFPLNNIPCYAGNVELLKNLQHVTSEVIESLDGKVNINLFEPGDEENMNLSLLTNIQTQNQHKSERNTQRNNITEKQNHIHHDIYDEKSHIESENDSGVVSFESDNSYEFYFSEEYES